VRDEAEYFRSVLDNLTGGFLSVDLEGRVVYMNPMAGRILRIGEVGAVRGRPYETALAAYPTLQGVVRETLETRRTVHRAEVQVTHADAAMTIGYSTLQVKNPAGECLGIGIIFQDLTLAGRKKLVG